MSDVNITAAEWVPMQEFQGNFNGDNHKITGKLTAGMNTAKYFGFFGSTNRSASIENLNMEAEVYAPDQVAVAGILGNVINLLKEDTFIVKNCTNSGKITGKTLVGGIIGKITFEDETMLACDKTFLENCTNKGEIVSMDITTGGIIGKIYIFPGRNEVNNAALKVTVKNCRNEGAVSGKSYIGGILGQAAAYSGTLIIKGCTNTGVVKLNETVATEQVGVFGTLSSLGLIVGANFYSGQGVLTIED